ncbi:MAG TPA: STAS domain-containing protein [Bacillota bacterium]
MRLLVEEARDALRIWCAGELEVGAVRSLLRLTGRLVRHGRPVVLDVGGIQGIDVVAAAMLIRVVRRLRQAGLPAVVAGADEDLRETLDLIGGSDVLGRAALDVSPGDP